MMSLSGELADLIRVRNITSSDLQKASLFTLDAVANMLAGRNTDAGRILLQWANGQGRDAGREAFVAGGLTHILETDDLHRASVTHPGCVVVPAALAVARREKCSGNDMLKAVLRGFEAMCRVGNAVGPAHYRIWHNTATCGPFGSAMTTASILNLDHDKTVHALGNAGTQSSGLWEFLDTGAMSKHLHAGRAAESGLIAADLAAAGFTGPPAILEGERGFFNAACPDAQPARVTAEPDAAWQLGLTSIKPWPCCRHTHPAIDAALDLRRQLGDRTISAASVETYQAALDVCDRPEPTSVYEAKFSLYHCVAAALNTGEVNFNSFDANARAAHQSLRGNISISASDPFASAYPDAWGAKVSATTADGEQLSVHRENAKGDPELALSDGEMISKATTLLRYGEISDDDGKWIIDQVMGLADSDDISDVLTFFSERLR
jgi:2-methylcitrate dehydratase PrpD